jgi:hypothetical protein
MFEHVRSFENILGLAKTWFKRKPPTNPIISSRQPAFIFAW